LATVSPTYSGRVTAGFRFRANISSSITTALRFRYDAHLGCDRWVTVLSELVVGVFAKMGTYKCAVVPA
jgi:hypothetical protein